MTHPKAPRIFLHLPDGADRNNLRAGLMAMQLVPENLPLLHTERLALLKNLSPEALNFLFIDISRVPPHTQSQFFDWVAGLSPTMKSRTLLTRLLAGHVSEQERQWVKSLGFVDLLPEFDTHSTKSGLKTALDLMAQTLHLPAVAADKLNNHVRAAAVATNLDSPRTVIRNQTGMAAEQLADLLDAHLDIDDRTYHFKKYVHCFTGTDAVRWMRQHLQLSSTAAVATGQALGDLGLLYHVTHQHPFSDEPLFFRFNLTRLPSTTDLFHILKSLQDQVSVASRTYLGTSYPNCWIGSEAVDVLCRQHSMARHEAYGVLHQLMQIGVFEHVANKQPMIDGAFFYRFTSDLHDTAA